MKEAKATQKKFKPPRFASGLSTLMRLLIFLLGSYLGKIENTLNLGIASKALTVMSIFRLLLKVRLREPSSLVFSKAKLPSSKKHIALSSTWGFDFSKLCSSTISNSNSSIMSLNVSKLFASGLELIISLIAPNEICLL